MLGPLDDNGGPTRTLALLPGSPAIDAGDDATCASPPVSGLDQRGTARPQGAHCDIGAYEYTASAQVTLSGNTGVGGTTLTYIDGGTKTVTADGSGNYSITVPYGWGGTVTPSKTGYVFSPGSLSFSDLQGDQAAQNFTASLAPGNLIKALPANNADGQALSPTLSWQAGAGLSSYEYCYSSVPGPCTKWNSVSGNTSVTLHDLAPNYTYYWQVRGASANNFIEADSGIWWTFTTTATAACSWPAYIPPTSPTFADVPMTAGHWSWVERLVSAGITSGCGGGNYCPFSEVVRAQMAIFLLRSKHCGNSYTPPPVDDSTGFADVPVSASYAPWVKQLAAEGITSGCGGGNFCPLEVVNRAQMAIFLLRARHGSTYSPPPVGDSTGFGDVPLDATYAPWVKQLVAEGITSGCGNDNFCPLQAVNRAQMATFQVRAFNLP